jgi:hypothetical protein
MKKYNIGSPKRPGKTKSKTAKTPSYKKKYNNIGRPQKVIVTPDTPRSKKWKKIREQSGYKSHEISDYEPDEDEEVLENATEPGTYTTFEETITPYMKYALQKKPFTRLSTDAFDEQVDEEAWINKPDDSPNKLYPKPKRLLPYPHPQSPSKRHRPSRTKGRSRSRTSRTKGRGRSRRTRG